MRIKGTSVYKGDLGKVASMEDGGKRAKVKVLSSLVTLVNPNAYAHRPLIVRHSAIFVCHLSVVGNT